MARVLIFFIALLIGLNALIVFVWKLEDWEFAFIPLLILLAVALVLYHQINWWGFRFRKPKIDRQMDLILQKVSPYYANLEGNLSDKFQYRLALFIEAKEFIPMGFQKVPYDFQVFASTEAIRLTLALDDFLLKGFDQIVIYKHPFPSPNYPFLHNSEIEFEDGVIIFSIERLVAGLRPTPSKDFNIGLYEFSRVLLSKKAWDAGIDLTWDLLEEISGETQAFVSGYIGLPDPDIRAVAIVYLFEYPDSFQETEPLLFRKINRYLGDP